MIYQLSLDIFNDECNKWVHLNTEDKVRDINLKIVAKINSHCEDNTTDVENGINTEKCGFRCQELQNDHVVYNVHLLQTANANVTKLVSCMDSWIKLPKTPTILVTGAEYDINKACSGVLTDSDSSPYICSWLPPKSKLDVASGIAIALGIMLFIILVSIIATIVVGVIVKKRYNDNYY